MNPVTILDNAYATLVFEPDDKIIHHTFHQPLGGEDFHNVLLAGYNALKKYGATKWLSDDRNNAAVSDEDMGWANTVWFPLVQSAGWKHWALVVPESIRARMNLNAVMRYYFDQGVSIMVFTDPVDAHEWLEKQ